MSNVQVQDDQIHLTGYTLQRTIGQGTYGKVKLAIQDQTGRRVAVKIIEKSQVRSPKQVARLQREIRFLRLLHHPHIVKVYEVLETEVHIFIVMEYAVGGELFDYIVANKRVKENEARAFFRQVLSAVDYCHKNAVIHRDLKPENLLLDDRKTIKIIDFGFGNNFWQDGLLDTFCGSPFYASPEMILGKKYEGPEVDMWSLGVILFALLCGHLPFDDDNMKELYRKIASGTYVCPDYLMPGARHLISRLITVDPKKRATLEEALNHPWVNEGYQSTPPNYLPYRPNLKPEELDEDIIHRLAAFNFERADVTAAFSEAQQFRPHPIRATYFLLSEMLRREAAGQRVSSGSGQEGVPARVASSGQMDGPTHLANIGRRDFVSMQALSNLPHQRPNPIGGSMLSVGTDQKVAMSPQHIRSPSENNISPPSLQQDPRRPVSVLGTYSDARQSSIPSNLLMIPDGNGAQRRHSTLAVTTGNDVPRAQERRTSSSKIVEELRAVSGWFLNVSAQSTKSPMEIIHELERVLTQNQVPSTREGPYTFTCRADVTAILGSGHAEKDKNVVVFQIELCAAPKVNACGLHFKRVAGGVWDYKKICNKLLSQMNL